MERAFHCSHAHSAWRLLGTTFPFLHSVLQFRGTKRDAAWQHVQLSIVHVAGDSVSVVWFSLLASFRANLTCAWPRTGVFCNSAIKAAESDHEMVVQSLVQTRQELRDQVSSVFHQRLGQVFVFADECEFQSCATVSANKLVFENTVCTLVCDMVAHVDQP